METKAVVQLIVNLVVFGVVATAAWFGKVEWEVALALAPAQILLGHLATSPMEKK